MKKSKRNTLSSILETEVDHDEAESVGNQSPERNRFWTRWSGGERIGAIAICLLLVAGTFGAGLKYLEDSAREQKLNAKNPSSKENTSLLNSVNPFFEPPLPTSTPQLSKEYLYAGSRMLAVEDANASAVPPSDLAVWRPSTGYWYVLGGQGSQQTSVQWGSSGDVTVPGDYDGDGKTDFSVYRPSAGAWYIQRSSDNAFVSYSFGQSTDQVAQADYDGDGKTDAAVVRLASGLLTWYIQFSSTGNFVGYQFGSGTAGDVPTPADFDGDGKADLAVWRTASQANFYYLKSSDSTAPLQTIQFGQTNDKPIPADYDGDGKADAAVKRGNDWIIKQSSTNTTQTVSWYAGTFEVQNDYDGDGKVDIAVWDNSNGVWSIRQSSHIGQSNELRQVQWGSTGDKPVPAFYRR